MCLTLRCDVQQRNIVIVFGYKTRTSLFVCSVMHLNLPQSTVQDFPKIQNLRLNVCTSQEKTQRQLKLQNITKNPSLTYPHYFWYLAMIVCPVLSVSVTFKLPVAAHLFVCCLLVSPLIIRGCHHPYLTLDLSQNAMGHQRGLSPKAFLTVRVTVATGCCWGVS